VCETVKFVSVSLTNCHCHFPQHNSRYSQLNFAKHNRTRTQEPMETS
jgi:hypothetical protein